MLRGLDKQGEYYKKELQEKDDLLIEELEKVSEELIEELEKAEEEMRKTKTESALCVDDIRDFAGRQKAWKKSFKVHKV